jgi:tetratricopeptide (TPR) repeat protein
MDAQPGNKLELDKMLHWIIANLPESDESVARAHNLRGLLLEHQGDLKGAASEFELANDLAERNELQGFDVAYYNLAQLTLDNAMTPGAEKAKLIARARGFGMQALARQRSGFAYDILGRIEQADGNPTAAKRDLDTAIAVAPDDPIGYWDRANLLASQGTPIHDMPLAIQDRYRAFDLFREYRQDVPLTSQLYVKLADELLSQSQEMASALPDSVDSSDSMWVVILPAAEGAVPSPVAIESMVKPDDIAEWRQRRRASLLREACEVMRTAVGVWETSSDASLSEQQRREVIAFLAKASNALTDASNALAMTPPACVALPPT